jgi:hypothetical protein
MLEEGYQQEMMSQIFQQGGGMPADARRRNAGTCYKLMPTALGFGYT